jgi:hypothetical protein
VYRVIIAALAWVVDTMLFQTHLTHKLHAHGSLNAVTVYYNIALACEGFWVMLSKKLLM